jgi:hypothetical protein
LNAPRNVLNVWLSVFGPRNDLPRARLALVADLREELGASDADLVLGLLDARGGGAQVVVAGERLVDQAAQRQVVEDVEPGLVGERGSLARRQLAAVGRRHLRLGLDEVRTDGTGAEQASKQRDETRAACR